MKNIIKTSLVIALTVFFASACATKAPVTQSSSAKVQAVYTNANVYTVNVDQEWAQAFAVADGKFVAVGSNEDILAMAGDSTERVDLGGAFVTPGFIDSHFHTIIAAIVTSQLDVGDARSNEEQEVILREVAAAQTDKTVPIIGFGWHIFNYPPEGPRKELLDEIFGEQPVLFVRSDGHGAWANSAAFKLAGFDENTPDYSEHSFLGRDENGLTGYIEEVPQYLVLNEAMMGEISPQWIKEKLDRAFPRYPAAGITTVFDPGTFFAPTITSMEAIDMYNTDHGPSFRISMSHYAVNAPGVDDYAEAKKVVDASLSEDVFSDSIKINIDASIDTATAYVKDPYVGDYVANGRGVPMFSPEELDALVDKCYATGMNMHFHVTGDAGVEMIVSAMEKAVAKHGPGGPRANMTHAMMIDPADIPRMTPANTGVSMSGLWILRDEGWDSFATAVGEERADNMYLAGSLIKAGVNLGIAGDYPVAASFPSYKPLDQIEMMTTRRMKGQPEAPQLEPVDEVIGLADAIRAATLGNAWLMNKDRELGSIEAGKSADFVVLKDNLFDLDKYEVNEAKIMATYYKGNQTYKSD